MDQEKISSELAKTYRKIIENHDLKEYSRLERMAKKQLMVLKVGKREAASASKIVRKMYEISDEADEYLNNGREKEHDILFLEIEKNAEELDVILNIKNGSIKDEIKWWYSFRKARSVVNGKKPDFAKNKFYLTKSLIAIFIEHLNRLPKKIYAFPCTYYLARSGFRHINRRWEDTERYLKRYWMSKINGNNLEVNAQLMLV